MDLLRYPYQELPVPLRQQLLSLAARVWPSDEEVDVHREEFRAMSFCACLNGQLVGYAGVLRWPIMVKDVPYGMCGLSCVCADPDRRGQGIGSAVVGAATEWILRESGMDVGLFTCLPDHTAFYERGGVWRRDNSLILRESARTGAYQSDLLGVDVLKALLSPKALRHAADFTNATITLDFPQGTFI